MMQLNQLARHIENGARLADIADALDAASPAERLGSVHALGRSAQRRLYELAGTGPPAALTDWVPAGVAPLTPVHHKGRNTLPLPGRHRYFEKRFCRPAANADRLFGYNAAPSSGLVGPGYFIAVDVPEASDWKARGAVVIDYFRVPDGPVPAGWPPVVPNSSGLQRFVYHQTRDFMRKVSRHVTVGAAYKRERKLDHYFVLVRQDPS